MFIFPNLIIRKNTPADFFLISNRFNPILIRFSLRQVANRLPCRVLGSGTISRSREIYYNLF